MLKFEELGLACSLAAISYFSYAGGRYDDRAWTRKFGNFPHWIIEEFHQREASHLSHQ